MFGAIASLISLAVAGGAAVIGYWQAKQFTQNKLRYVDAVHKMFVPIGVGIAAALIATPVVWLVPFIGGGVAMGVAAGARDIRKRIGAG